MTRNAEQEKKRQQERKAECQRIGHSWIKNSYCSWCGERKATRPVK